MGSARSRPKLDLYKTHRAEYATPGAPILLRMPAARYLAIPGSSAPGDEEFRSKIGALYGVAYTLKFQQKAKGRDFKVLFLEGLYHPKDGSREFVAGVPMAWRLVIRVPDSLTAADLHAAVKHLQSRGKEGPLSEVRLTTIREGRCVQLLHIGSYSAEHPTVGRMIEFADSQGFAIQGEHHEIYLSNPGRVAPERLRTILRYSVRRKKGAKPG